MAVYQSLSVTQVSQNPEENSSRVRILWQSTQTGGSYNETRRTAQYTVSCNGGTPETYTVSYTLPMQTTAVILDVTLTVPHDSRGEGTVAVTTWMNTNISAGVVELSKNLELDTIPQAATLLATDASIGGISRIAISKKSGEHTHSLQYQFGTLSGYVDEMGQLQSREVQFSGDSVDFLLPASFYGEIPNDKSGICRLSLRTYQGQTQVGQPQTADFTAGTEETLCRPAVTGQVEDINEKTLALTGGKTVLVRHGSQALCVIQTQPKNGATLVRETIAGEQVFDGRLVISDPQMEQIVFSAEDSRGYVTQQTVALTVVDYCKPAWEVTVNRTDAVGGRARLAVAGACFTGSFGVEDNSLSAAYSLDGTVFVPMTVQAGEGRFSAAAELENMDYSRVYSITVRVWDKLFSQEKQAVLKKIQPVFDWGEEDFSFHVPVTMDSPLGLESGGTGRSQWQETGLVVKGEAALSTVPTAPGACYVPAGGEPRFGILPVAQGGTGGGDAQSALENLGLMPPMALGQEYLTAQRWMGEPVYTKIVDYGRLPKTKAQPVPHGAAATRMLGCRGTASDGRTLPWGGIHAYRADLFCNLESIYIDTEKDYSDLTAVVQIWYTK